jgi:hypothetical protein
MTIENKKLELIEDILTNSTIDLADVEEVARSIVFRLPMQTVTDICKTWPTCYEERNEILAKTNMIDDGMRILAMEILLNEATHIEKKVANG